MKLRLSTSLKVTVPLILLGFAAMLSTFILLYHVPQAERATEDRSRERIAQEMSRLQSTLEYLSLRGDLVAAQHEIAVLAHNHDIVLAAMTDERNVVVAATRRAWLGRPVAEVLPEFDFVQAAGAMREHRARVTTDATGKELLAYAGILMGSREREELRPSQRGSLFLAYDLAGPKAEARAQVVQQSLYWAGCVTALALAMWLVFHFLLTRRTARLVHAAEQLAAGNLAARSRLRGNDELGRLSRAFDAMAEKVASTQNRLRHDIAERARVQQALQNSEARLQQILNNTTSVVSVKDTSGRFLFVNRQWEHLFHLPQAEVLGRTEAELLPQASAGDSRSNDLAVLERNALVEFEETAPLDDGLHTYISIKFPLHDANGKAYAVCGISTDITEKKRSAEELARQREALHQREKLAALGSLLAGVAHELNNPLAVVVARAVLLEEQGDANTRAMAAKIRVAAERCARIVRSFLGMARQQPPERGPVALHEVVAAALDMTAYAMRTSGVEVVLDEAGDLPPILADADQIHQVLLNLLINAQQALQDQPPPRRIRLRTRHDAAANRVCVTVSDNGPGIPPALRTRVFEPYFTTKPTGIGTGVGLAVSLGIVEAHGGELTVDSPAGGGAVFDMALPVGDPHETAGGAGAVAPAPVKAKASMRRHKILIVDDETEVRETLAQILAGTRHRVVAVRSARDALRHMAQEPYDAILTDMRMPDLDGRALYREIERRWPDQAGRVVFVTGDTLSAVLNEFVSASGRPVIEKPFLPSEVRRVVAQVVAVAAASNG
ncbi:PAS domain-containing protein [Variovorax sp. J22G73]|uniref:hybrid sensor histidine kinase/response regulator n=1 Tax=unclassified Variovorax TaxID=663243 RepID=UPI002578E58B|nr:MULTISPECIES: hybrid sensor histidine kinase/response regulator [unclassified Variovorax]MDM0008177.1 PAS domain-containing protein [Variovorax sp. J22R203]MDM0100683.1 PAS domain-containing protein [Variovorax sp. J22G73]